MRLGRGCHRGGGPLGQPRSPRAVGPPIATVGKNLEAADQDQHGFALFGRLLTVLTNMCSMVARPRAVRRMSTAIGAVETLRVARHVGGRAAPRTRRETGRKEKAVGTMRILDETGDTMVTWSLEDAKALEPRHPVI